MSEKKALTSILDIFVDCFLSAMPIGRVVASVKDIEQAIRY